MKLRLVGVNHKTAPLELRERLAVSAARLPETLLQLRAAPELSEVLLLSTCNRVEMLAATELDPPGLMARFAAHFGFAPGELTPHAYELRDREAVRHIFRVASSLDSLVVGEPQVLGQVKEAYGIARRVGAVHSELDLVLTRAFAVAKRVRTETQIGSSGVSIASVAVELARKIFGSLAGRTVYLVGAGKMSELAARHLVAHGASAIFVANRTYDRARELAARFQGEAIRFEELYETASQADIVISSTGAPHPIFRREHGELFLQRRKNRPMFFIDIAVPRDVAAEVNELDGIFVYDIDDLQQVVAAHTADRGREAERAEAIIAEEVERFAGRIDTRAVVPTIISLQEHLEQIRQAEIDKVRGRLGRLNAEQELAVESLTRAIINKVLHAPITELKSAARDPHATTIIELIRRLFQLDREPASAEGDRAKERETSGAKR